MKDKLQKLIDAYQSQIDLYDKQTQLPWFWNGWCCTETSIELAKQFVTNLKDVLYTNE